MPIATYQRKKAVRPDFATPVDWSDLVTGFSGLQVAYPCSEGHGPGGDALAGLGRIHNILHVPWSLSFQPGFQNTPTWAVGPSPLGHCFHTAKDTQQRAYFNIGSNENLSLSQPTQFTIACWMRLIASVTSENNHLFGISVTNTSSPFERYTLFVGRVSGQAWLVHSIGGSETILDSNKTVNDGLPHHLAGTWDGSTVRVYVDGRQRNSASASGALGSTTADINIGAQLAHSNAPTADYAHCLIWNRCLPPAAVWRLYEQPSAYLQAPKPGRMGFFVAVPAAEGVRPRRQFPKEPPREPRPVATW